MLLLFCNLLIYVLWKSSIGKVSIIEDVCYINIYIHGKIVQLYLLYMYIICQNLKGFVDIKCTVDM